MDTSKFKSIAVRLNTHEKIKELAWLGRRSVPRQVELLVDEAWERSEQLSTSSQSVNSDITVN